MQPMSIEIEANGFGFIGDPHAWSRKPGRRLDADFTMTVIRKITQALAICAQENLIPVFLGDLLDDEEESDQRLMILLLRCLLPCPITPFTLIGNHEKKQSVLTDDTMVAALREAGALRTIEASGPACVARIGALRVLLGGTPYGQQIPKSVQSWVQQAGADKCIWLSHHDLAFDGAYPGSALIESIEGAFMLVNGHMHKRAPSVRLPGMVAHNPGNITRMSVDTRDQVPAIWLWRPEQGDELVPMELRHEKDIFDLSGLLIEGGREEKAISQARVELAKSKFSQLLRERSVEDRHKSDDAVFLREEMLGLFEQLRTPQELRADLLELLERAARG